LDFIELPGWALEHGSPENEKGSWTRIRWKAGRHGSQVPGDRYWRDPRRGRFADRSAPHGYVAADLAQSWLKALVRSAAIAGASRVSIWLRCNMYTSLPSRRIPMEGDDGGYPVK
jgi:hypothetical protein